MRIRNTPVNFDDWTHALLWLLWQLVMGRISFFPQFFDNFNVNNCKLHWYSHIWWISNGLIELKITRQYRLEECIKPVGISKMTKVKLWHLWQWTWKGAFLSWHILFVNQEHVSPTRCLAQISFFALGTPSNSVNVTRCWFVNP